MSTVHESYVLYISPEAYSLVAQSAEKPETLVISRQTNSLSIQPGATPPARAEQELVVYGLFGVISLLQSDYLIVITKRTKVASVLNSTVYSASDFSLFPIDKSRSSSDLLKNPEEAYLLGLVKSHLYTASFYYTYGGYQIATRLQEQQVTGDDKPFWQKADDRFFWNRHLQGRLINATTVGGPQDFSRFILPITFGCKSFVEFRHASINGREFQFGLVSRRNRYRAGTRYFSRGIDQGGNVSNFNETEQIVVLTGTGTEADVTFAFVQTRGSVPVYWAEINNLRYKPDLKVLDLATTADSLRRHFDQQVSLYGDQFLVNLVNSSGYEKPVKEAYERALAALGNERVHYTYFDFHKECKGLRFDRVGVLIDQLHEDLERQGYFYHDASTSSQPQRKQTSVVRTNCMDCLDRTNVVQSALGKWVLNNQLRQVGVLSVKESIEEHATFLDLFRNVWADNADVVSRAYSGTGALKTDYTRTGKRSKEGALQDGINSAIRYIKNNFLDGPRQDAYDLVTGTWVPTKGGDEVGWLADQRDLAIRAAPYVLLVSFCSIFTALFASSLVNDYVASPTKVVVFSFVVAGFSMHSILTNGIDYVAHPRLSRKAFDEVLNYSGKGFESGRHGRPVKKKLVSVEHAAKVRQAKREPSSLLPSLASPQIKQE
ncbi:hypothetical protein BMF94_0683 [Rhodotorula taiwanensis]|uniref:SAC domain-containing protein n=1 Tax=Rhodotorula taiwanensis TaxID=741276 RepID=A0A2S5BI87_9BASI|nr:hypothetical protein BMF94_0683 [Rhodotorula taiwanensis]